VKSHNPNALPIIITHGWPGSIIELLGVIDPLSNPTAHGGRAEDAFEVVIPSIPGYGFSGKPTGTGWDPDHIARAWGELMKRLGYTRYVAQGGDWGSPITEAMARQMPAGLAGIHVNLPATVPPEIGAAVGTDAGQPFVPPGYGVHLEMQQFAAAGIPIEDVWTIATWKAADMLNRPDLGRVRAGARAALIVFREDPTKDLATLSTIEAVVADGKLYRRRELDSALTSRDRHFSNPVFDAISTRVARSTLDESVLRNY